MCFLVNNVTEVQTSADDGGEEKWKGPKKVMVVSQIIKCLLAGVGRFYTVVVVANLETHQI